jgi:hypothetical protein
MKSDSGGGAGRHCRRRPSLAPVEGERDPCGDCGRQARRPAGGQPQTSHFLELLDNWPDLLARSCLPGLPTLHHPHNRRDSFLAGGGPLGVVATRDVLADLRRGGRVGHPG